MSRLRLGFGLAVVAGLATTIAVYVGAGRDPWRRLVSSAGGHHRVSHGRLAILDAGAPAPRVTRSGLMMAPEQPAGLLADAYAVLASSDADDHRKAAAALIAGRAAEAERFLRAIPERDRNGTYWNDLAVVLAAKGSESQDETLIEALAAADRAIDGDAATLPALFNRALIIDRLGLAVLARSAYVAYLRADSTSEWAAEARRRLVALESIRGRAAAWERLVPTLVRPGVGGDRDPVAAAATSYPELARRWGETECLAGWADAMSRGDTATAASYLAAARIIGDTLRRTKGEGMLAGAVAAIDRASNHPATLGALVSAHQLHREATRLNAARQTRAAAEKFEEARPLFERASSTMAFTARFFMASAAVDVGDHTRAMQMVEGLMAEAPPELHFLHGQLHRLRATILFFNGRFEEALSSQRAAHQEFMAIGEVSTAVELTGRMAAALTGLGRPHEAWPMLRSALAAAGEDQDPKPIQSLLHAAAFVGMTEQRWEIACALLNLELDTGGVDTRLAEAAIWRVLAADRAGLSDVILPELERARKVAAAIADRNFREGAENEIRLTEALVTGDQAPERARELLTVYLAVAEKRGRLTRVPSVLVARAALSKQLSRFDEAESDLRAAIATIEERGNRVERDVLRDTFLGRSSDAYVALADVLDSRADYDAALDAADQSRARILIDRERGRSRPEPIQVGEIASLIPPETALIAFGFYADRTVRYVITTRDLQRIATSTSVREIETSIRRFNSAIDSDDDTRAEAEGRWLYSVLIAPAREILAGRRHLVIVDEPSFANLSFASLIDPGGSFLVENSTITITPSIRAFATAAPRRQRRAASLLSVGNPSIDPVRYPGLQPIEWAAREAKEVAALYERSILLTEKNATKNRITSALQSVDTAHLATHAISAPVNPEISHLLVATAAGSDDALTTTEIATMNLHHLDTVVATGCRTATPSQGYGYVRSISSAFLAAGTKNVVASLWDVEDRAGSEFSIRLHRALRSGVDPAEAMQKVQLQMMRSPDRRFNRLAAWAAMQLYAAGH